MDSKRMSELARSEEWFIIETFARLIKDSPEQIKFMEDYNSVKDKEKLGVFNIDGIIFHLNGVDPVTIQNRLIDKTGQYLEIKEIIRIMNGE